MFYELLYEGHFGFFLQVLGMYLFDICKPHAPTTVRAGEGAG